VAFTASEISDKAKEKEPAKDAPPKNSSLFPTIQFKTYPGLQEGRAAIPPSVQKSDAGKWAILQPKPLSPIRTRRSLVVHTQLAHLRPADRREASDVAPWGLANPSLEVIVTKKDGKTEDLLVGDDTPTGGGTFVS